MRLGKINSVLLGIMLISFLATVLFPSTIPAVICLIAMVFLFINVQWEVASGVRKDIDNESD